MQKTTCLRTRTPAVDVITTALTTHAHEPPACALPSNIPTPSSKLRRVKCSAMNGDCLVGKQRSRYGSPSRTSGLCDTLTFSPLTSSVSLVKSHNRRELSSEPRINGQTSRRCNQFNYLHTNAAALTRRQDRPVPAETQRVYRTSVPGELGNQMPVRQVPD